MRSFSGVNVLIAVLVVLAVCALANPHTAYDISEWLYEGGSSLIHHAEDFVRGSA